MTTRNVLLTKLATIASCSLLSAAVLGQNLVTNGDFTAGNLGFTSDYAFVASGSSASPGTYAVRTDPQTFHPGDVAFVDHTTGTGNMMLVDGRFNFTAWSETVATTMNTSYTFSVWVTPSNDLNQPTLRFFVNSVQVGADLALSPITAGQWFDFSTIWDSAGSTSATLSIIDINSSDFVAGNDFALDDISFAAVPEPRTFGLVIGGGLLLSGILARQRRRS